MKATLVSRNGDHATVRLTPSWLSRLFGARERSVKIWRGHYNQRGFCGDRCDCKSIGDGWWVRGEAKSSERILLAAIDFVPVAELPAATAITRPRPSSRPAV